MTEKSEISYKTKDINRRTNSIQSGNVYSASNMSKALY